MKSVRTALVVSTALVSAAVFAAQPITQLLSSSGVIPDTGHMTDRFAPTNGGGVGLSGLIKEKGTGALTVVVNGAPALPELQALFVDNSSLFRAYGGIGNGTSHPLSSITRFGAYDTTGYTLSQWQALFTCSSGCATGTRNPVTALSNEIDEVAIQAMVNLVGPSSTTNVSLPGGVMLLTHPIQSGCSIMKVSGAPSGTSLWQTGYKQDGWDHGTTTTPCPRQNGDILEMHNLHFNSRNYARTALEVVYSHGTIGLLLDKVSVDAGDTSTPYFFHDGIYTYDTAAALFENVNIAGGGASAMTGVGLMLDGDGVGEFEFIGGNIGGYSDCVGAYSGGPPADTTTGTAHGDVEGLELIGTNIGTCQRGVAYSYNGIPGQSAQFYSVGSQYGAIYGTWLELPHLGEIAVDNNLVYLQPQALAAYGNGTSGSNQFPVLQYNTAAPAVGADAICRVVGSPTNLFPAGTIVTSVTSGTITLSNNATATTNPALGATCFFLPVEGFAGTFNGTTQVTLDHISGNLKKGSSIDGNSQIPTGTTIVSVDASTRVMTMSAAATGSTSGTLHVHVPPAAPLIDATNQVRARYSGNSFASGLGANASSLGYFANNIGVVIKDNFMRDTGTLMTAGWTDGGGNSFLVEKDDQWVEWRGLPKVSGAPFASGTGARWASFYADNGCDLGSSGKVTCASPGPSLVPTDANSNGTAPISVPPVFVTTPTIFAINGDFIRTRSACGFAGGSGTPTQSSPRFSFNVVCSSAPSTTVGISWTAVGQ